MSRQCPERLLPPTGPIRSFFELRWRLMHMAAVLSFVIKNSLPSSFASQACQTRSDTDRPVQASGLNSRNPRVTKKKNKPYDDAIHVSRLLTGARVRKHSRARLLIVTSSRPPHLSNTLTVRWPRGCNGLAFLPLSVPCAALPHLTLPGLGHFPPRAASWLPSSKPLMTDRSPWRDGKSNGHGTAG